MKRKILVIFIILLIVMIKLIYGNYYEIYNEEVKFIIPIENPGYENLYDINAEIPKTATGSRTNPYKYQYEWIKEIKSQKIGVLEPQKTGNYIEKVPELKLSQNVTIKAGERLEIEIGT